MTRTPRALLLLALVLPLAAPTAFAVSTDPPESPYRLNARTGADVACIQAGPPPHAELFMECGSFSIEVSPNGVNVTGCLPLIRVGEKPICLQQKLELKDLPLLP